jgi:membrane protein DedA with SNARE-associated domain
VDIFERIISHTGELELNLLVLLFSFLEYLFPIVPGDLSLAFGIFMGIYGGYSILIIFGSSILGGALGATTTLLIGRFIYKKYDQTKLTTLLNKYSSNSEEKIEKALTLINRYGLWIIILNRFIPVLRGPIVFVAGYSKVGFLKSLIGAIISAILFNLMITAISFVTGKNFEHLNSFLSYYFEGFIILAIIGFIIYKIVVGIKRRKRI